MDGREMNDVEIARASHRPSGVGRRRILLSTAAAGAALGWAGRAAAQGRPAATQPQGATPSGPSGLLRPQQNQFRNVLDLSGLWRFQLDPQEEGETQGRATALPAPRTVPVPCSGNDLFDDARDYLDLAWYQT